MFHRSKCKLLHQIQSGRPRTLQEGQMTVVLFLLHPDWLVYHLERSLVAVVEPELTERHHSENWLEQETLPSLLGWLQKTIRQEVPELE